MSVSKLRDVEPLKDPHLGPAGPRLPVRVLEVNVCPNVTCNAANAYTVHGTKQRKGVGGRFLYVKCRDCGKRYVLHDRTWTEEIGRRRRFQRAAGRK